MTQPFGSSPDQTRFDVEFSVPMVHRLRFTQDCFGADFPVLVDLFEEDPGAPSRVLVWIDDGLVQWESQFDAKVTERLGAVDSLELVAKATCVPGGEIIKSNPDYIHEMLSAINRYDMDRRSYIVAIGGGAVLDAVGYAAAIAHRGIRLIRLPTTTLAQADSGVGVKNAVNWFGKKNWKGTFAAPWAVVNDQGLLASLSNRDFCSGFSEAVKVSLLKDPELFDFLGTHAREISARCVDPAATAIRRSVLLHLQHITRGGDPFETQQARPLDFGHWSAHKLEAVTDYRLRHGEAVSIGVAIDTAYSYLTQGLDWETAERTFSTLLELRLPIWDVALDDDVVFRGLEEFRQHLGGQLTITLIKALGQPLDVHQIRESAMREAIQMVKYYATEVHSTGENSAVA